MEYQSFAPAEAPTSTSAVEASTSAEAPPAPPEIKVEVSEAQAAEQELPTITFNLETDVGITFTTPWQAAATTGGNESWKFTIDGPPEVRDFISKNAIGSDTNGVLSPPMKVTINDPKARKAAGIPLQVTSYCFCYPLECLAGKYEEIISRDGLCEPWVFFLLLGGFAYFDHEQNLVRTNAFVLTPGKASLTHVGPFRPSDEAMKGLRDTERLRAVTLRPLLQSGFERFAWTNPAERPGGHPLLADGTDPPGAGCFVYEMDTGVSVMYPLVTKKRETQLLQRKKAEEDAAREARKTQSKSPSLKEQVSRGAAGADAHDKLMSSFGKVAAAALAAVDAAKKLQNDLDQWRRTRVETWMRTNGLFILTYYALGSVAYMYFEGWSLLDALYYMTAVATTNGDELNPVTHPGKLFSTLYIIIGITVVMGGIAPLALFVIDPIKDGILDPIALALAKRFDARMQQIKSRAKQLMEDAQENDWYFEASIRSVLLRVQELVDMMVGGAKDASLPGSVGDNVESHRQAAIQASFKGYFTALMLFFGVLLLGLTLSMTVHQYTLIEGLYWTVGCMTTAGGDLKADSDLLKVLYIFYMPLAVVGALTAANTLIKTSKLRRVRLENYEVSIGQMLHDQAKIAKNPYLEMREPDFVLSVLKHHELVDQETILAIRDHFKRLTDIDARPRHGDSERIIDAQVVFKHLQRQGRIVAVNKDPAHSSLSASPPGGPSTRRRFSAVFVDTAGDDEGYSEWWNEHWVAQVDGEDGSKTPSKEGYARLKDVVSEATREASKSPTGGAYNA